MIAGKFSESQVAAPIVFQLDALLGDGAASLRCSQVRRS